LETRVVQPLPDRADAAVHHVARADGVRAGLDMADGRAGDQLERRVVVDVAVADDPAVAVRGVLAKTHVGEEEQVRETLAQRSQRLLDDAVLVPRARSLLVLRIWNSEEEHRLDAEARELLCLARKVVDREAAERRQPLVHLARRPDEERKDEVVEIEASLAHQRAESSGSAQTPQTDNR